MKGLKTILVGMTITMAGGFMFIAPELSLYPGFIMMLAGVVTAIYGLLQKMTENKSERGY